MEKIGKYQIIEVLGKGAMGIVYKALDPDINREVAIKTVHFDVVSEGPHREEILQRFMREAQAAGKLSNPNIVTIYDVGREGDLTYIVMQYVEGKSLQKALASGEKFSIQQVVQLMAQVCQALDYAHQKGIVHRDIKPGNILLDKNGAPFLVDFGVARLEASTVTQSGTIMGTPSYMSPEQVMGKKIDKRSDIFSLGVVLYELLTGKKPFEGESITTVIYKIVHEQPISLLAVKRNIPKGFDHILGKALNKDPEKRYQSCRELAQDLFNLAELSGQTLTYDLVKETQPEAKKRKKWKWAVIPGVSVAVLVIIVGGILYLDSQKGKKARDKSSLQSLAKMIPSKIEIPGLENKSTEPSDSSKVKNQAPDLFGQMIVDKTNKIKESFEKQIFGETVKLSEELLKVQADNPVAQDYLNRAAAKMKELAIAQKLAQGIAEYNNGNLEQSQRLMEEVLTQDKENKEAQKYLYLADTALSKKEILQVLERQRKAEMDKDLLSLLGDIGSTAIVNQRKEDAILLFNNYDGVNSRMDDISVQFKDRGRAEVTFSYMLTGVYKKTMEEKVLFKGIKTWTFERQGKAWKIVDFHVE